MTSIPEKSNYTKIPNELLEKLASISMPGEQWRVLMAIIRKTYGWSKRSDWIALSQFSEMTGINRRHVNRSIRSLENKNIISVTKSGDKKHPSYRINIKYITWKIEQASPKRVTKSDKDIDIKQDNSCNDEKQVSPDSVITVTRSGDLLSPSSGTTKDTITKDTITTTTTGGGCGENSFSENQNPPANEGQLTAEQEHFIELEVDRAVDAGEIKKSKAAYKGGLKRKAVEGQLDISGLPDLIEHRQRKLLSAHAKQVEAMTYDECQKYFTEVAQNTIRYGHSIADVGGEEVMFTTAELKNALSIPQLKWHLEDVMNENNVDMDHYRREKAKIEATYWEADEIINFMVEHRDVPNTMIEFSNNGKNVLVPASEIIEIFEDSHPDLYADYVANDGPRKTPTSF